MTQRPNMTTGKINNALREKYKAPEYALMFEVGNKTGFGCNRHADAIAMSLWPSRGLELIGFEVKASRSDWLRELKDPAKAEKIAAFCDRWFIVAAEGIVKPGEMPVGWGHIEAKGGKLKTIKQAPEKPAAAIDRGFMAAMLRRASEADERLLASAVAARTKEIRESHKSEMDIEVGYRTRQMEKQNARLRDVISSFEEASGILLSEYSDGKIEGSRLKAALLLGEDYNAPLGRMIAQCKKFIEDATAIRTQTTGDTEDNHGN